VSHLSAQDSANYSLLGTERAFDWKLFFLTPPLTYKRRDFDDCHPHMVAAAQFAIDGNIEHSQIAMVFKKSQPSKDRLKWSGKIGQRAKMYPTLMNGCENDEATELFRQV
jgi:hypothetical protein